MLKISKPLCNHQSTYITCTTLPNLSWKLTSDNSGVMQTAYEVQVAREPDFNTIITSSGRVGSGRSQQVPCPNFTPEPGMAYCVRVQVWDNMQETSGWSEAAGFEMAPAGELLEKACFITAETDADAASAKGTYLATSFSLSKNPTCARVYATALGCYQLWVNGIPVNDNIMPPGWSEYGKRLYYQNYDVRPLLRAGENRIVALVAPGWYKGRVGFTGHRSLYGNKTALFLCLRACDEDGVESVIVSDSSWFCHDSPLLFSEIYDGETYDARLEDARIHDASCDLGCLGWRRVYTLKNFTGKMYPQEHPPIRALDEILPVALLKTPAGETVLDFGQNMTGRVRFKVNGQSGARVVLRHAEVLDGNGNFYTLNLASAKQRLEYTLKGNGDEWQPLFTYMGFRYVCVDEWPGEIHPDDFAAVQLGSSYEDAGSFTCSNPLVNQLIHNIRAGMRCNFLDVPIDSPQRDGRVGWTGDAQIFIRTACYLGKVYPFFQKWLTDLADAQHPDGSVPFTVPDALEGKTGKAPDLKGNDRGSAAWGDAAVICPWTLYLTTGDVDILRRQYPSMTAWVEYMRAHATEGLIWEDGFHFGDWLAPDADPSQGEFYGSTPQYYLSSAYYAYSTGILAKIATILGLEKDATEYDKLYVNIKKAFAGRYLNEDGNLSVQTQTAYAVALAFELLPEENRSMAAATLAGLIRDNDGLLRTGFVGTPYLCFALSQNGQLEAAYDLLLQERVPGWLYQVKMGATTVWENWDGLLPDGTPKGLFMNSFNHYAYGAIGDWLFRVAAGLEIVESEPGYRHILFQPQPGGGFTQVDANHESEYGRVRIHWAIERDHISIELHVPVNTYFTLQYQSHTVHGGSGVHHYRFLIAG